MTKPIRGVVHGRTIDLTDDPGLMDGQEVEVVIRPATKNGTWGEGIRRSAGAWSNVPDIDNIVDEIQRLRREATFRDDDR